MCLDLILEHLLAVILVSDFGSRKRFASADPEYFPAFKKKKKKKSGGGGGGLLVGAVCVCVPGGVGGRCVGVGGGGGVER